MVVDGEGSTGEVHLGVLEGELLAVGMVAGRTELEVDIAGRTELGVDISGHTELEVDIAGHKEVAEDLRDVNCFVRGTGSSSSDATKLTSLIRRTWRIRHRVCQNLCRRFFCTSKWTV